MAFYNFYLRIEANSLKEANEKMEKFIKVVGEHKEKGFFTVLGETIAATLWELKKLHEQDFPPKKEQTKPETQYSQGNSNESYFNNIIKQLNLSLIHI